MHRRSSRSICKRTDVATVDLSLVIGVLAALILLKPREADSTGFAVVDLTAS